MKQKGGSCFVASKSALDFGLMAAHMPAMARERYLVDRLIGSQQDHCKQTLTRLFLSLGRLQKALQRQNHGSFRFRAQ